MTRLITALSAGFATLFFASCVTTDPYATPARAYHQPEIAVAMPTSLDERESRFVGAIADTLQRAGYIVVYPGSGLAARFRLHFDVDRNGPIDVYSTIEIRDEADRVYAKGESSRPAVTRLFGGERVYDEVFSESLDQFGRNLPPAQRSPYRGGGYGRGGYGGYTPPPAYQY